MSVKMNVIDKKIYMKSVVKMFLLLHCPSNTKKTFIITKAIVFSSITNCLIIFKKCFRATVLRIFCEKKYKNLKTFWKEMKTNFKHALTCHMTSHMSHDKSHVTWHVTCLHIRAVCNKDIRLESCSSKTVLMSKTNIF